MSETPSVLSDPVRYDHVVVGGGIISILEAVDAARNGKRVALVEREAVLGGAWRLFELPGFGITELGPHVLRHHREAYDYIESNLCPMDVLYPEPIWLLHRPVLGMRKFPFKYLWVRDMLCLRDGIWSRPEMSEHDKETNKINQLNDRSFLGWREAARRLFSLGLGIAYEKYRLRPVIKYFRNGTSELMRRLEDELSRFGVDTYLGVRVDGVKLGKDSIIIEANSHRFECGALYMTTGVALDYVQTADGRYDFKRRTLNYRQVFVSVDCPSDAFTYIEVIDHPRIRRVFDITPYTALGVNEPDCGRRLITATITGSNDDPKVLAEELMTYLVKSRIIKGNAHWRLIASNTYQVNSYENDEAEVLINADDRCNMKRTTDMSLALKQRAEMVQVTR